MKWIKNNNLWSEDDPINIYSFFIHTIGHSMYIIILISSSYLFFHSYLLHSLYILYVFFKCTWNGGIRYYKMMTLYHMKKMESLFDSESKKSK